MNDPDEVGDNSQNVPDEAEHSYTEINDTPTDTRSVVHLNPPAPMDQSSDTPHLYTAPYSHMIRGPARVDNQANPQMTSDGDGYLEPVPFPSSGSDGYLEPIHSPSLT